MTRLIAFAGSARTASFNKKLARVFAAHARVAGAEVEDVDLRDFPMPLYDGDLEEQDGVPAAAAELRGKLVKSDGFLIACPEYNSSITPLLKNAIDWVSRPGEGVPALAAFSGKVCGLVSASPGGLGGLRGLVHVRAILSSIGALVVPDQMAVSAAHKAFSDGEPPKLVDEGIDARVAAVAQRVVEVAGALGA